MAQLSDEALKTTKSVIPNAQEAKTMRHLIENKGLLDTKGKLYAGTGDTTSTGAPVTAAIDPKGAADGAVLVKDSTQSTGWKVGLLESGSLTDGAVGTKQIADSAVTTEKIADGAVGTKQTNVEDLHRRFATLDYSADGSLNNRFNNYNYFNNPPIISVGIATSTKFLETEKRGSAKAVSFYCPGTGASGGDITYTFPNKTGNVVLEEQLTGAGATVTVKNATNAANTGFTNVSPTTYNNDELAYAYKLCEVEIDGYILYLRLGNPGQKLSSAPAIAFTDGMIADSTNNQVYALKSFIAYTLESDFADDQSPRLLVRKKAYKLNNGVWVLDSNTTTSIFNYRLIG